MTIIIFLSIFPIFIWSLMSPLGSRFSDINTITTSLGQISGLVGMVLFSVNIILAGRFKFLDKYFKGLDKVYVNHSKIGSIAFSLMLFHPLFLVIKYLIVSTREAALFFVPFINMPISWGILSLLIMIILISLTFYIKIKYNVWKISHKFMTLAFLFAILHTMLISSDVSRNNILRYYILILALFALFVILRKFLMEKFSINRFKYNIKNVKQLNKDILEIEMEPFGQMMTYLSGQFAFFSFLSSGVSSESHPFSISSSDVDTNLKITVKNLGDYTGTLINLKQGDNVIVDGPYGNFSYKNVTNKNQIWIAGGIGITPFYSMAQVLNEEYYIDFYYCVKEEGEAVYVKELQDIALKNPNFKFNLWSTKDKGFINGEIMSTESGGLADKDIFFCGPPILMNSLKEQFISLGININKIHYENFNF